ncbi:protein of unknown function [Azospirillum baldaniorum]|uniref:Uncharacterized protein n=1 Tax=Azospirillum baldaniorum TaxID=1064539 RepID=A0A9P1JTB6_9PROT|nr:protein of unknown function [Azospirillum baldaniorum]
MPMKRAKIQFVTTLHYLCRDRSNLPFPKINAAQNAKRFAIYPLYHFRVFIAVLDALSYQLQPMLTVNTKANRPR